MAMFLLLWTLIRFKGQKTLTIFQKKQKKLLVIIISMILSFSIFAGLAFIIIPKYLEIKQIERDDTTKCKSYRALEEIAVC